MNNLTLAITKYFSSLYKRLELSKSWQLALRSERRMIGYLLRVLYVLQGRISRSYVLAIVVFSRRIRSYYRSQGPKGTALYLKACHTILVKSVSGAPIRNVFKTFSVRVPITGRGIPKIIPSVMRKRILNGDKMVIKFGLSLFSIYRIMECKGTFSLNTIQDPGVEFNLNPFLKFIPIFFKRLSVEKNLVVKPGEPVILTKSGPGVLNEHRDKDSLISLANTTCALVVQAVALRRNGVLYSAFVELAKKTNQTSLITLLDQIVSIASKSKYVCGFVPEFLGKLGVKDEPNKVRVFAMVDGGTQMLLRPIHEAIFGILNTILQDATFDQDKGVRRGVEIFRRTGGAASYDLKAATDRLSVILQMHLMDYLFPGAGEAGKTLLVEREYQTPFNQRKLGRKTPKTVKYAVGQPMGALSSWAMLALTHHFIVQYAAYKVGYKGGFRDYLILGDDLVIFNKEVARMYLVIMRTIGVQINLSKSVVSKEIFEFAKRICHREYDLSPISFKEMDVASKNIDAAVLLFKKFNPDGTIASFARFKGFGYKSLSLLTGDFSKFGLYLRNLVASVTKPGVSNSSFPDGFSWLAARRVGEQVTAFSQTIVDRMVYIYNSTVPYGYDPSGGSSLQGYFQSSKESLGAPLGGAALSGGVHYTPSGSRKELPYEYMMEQLEWSLHSAFYPIKDRYKESIRRVDSLRSLLDEKLPITGIEECNQFLEEFDKGLEESSLVPTQKIINARRVDDLKARPRVGRGLKGWSLSRRNVYR